MPGALPASMHPMYAAAFMSILPAICLPGHRAAGLCTDTHRQHRQQPGLLFFELAPLLIICSLAVGYKRAAQIFQEAQLPEGRQPANFDRE